MTMKLSISVGAVSLAFEGSEQDFASKIASYADKIMDLTEQVDLSTTPATGDGTTASKANLQMTMKGICTKLNISNGSELLYAAVASLSVVKGMDKFNRQQINAEMKSAVGFYKATYTSNLSSYIGTLLKDGVLIEIAESTYTVKESERQLMEQKLAA
jgi:hypothetical protein